MAEFAGYIDSAATLLQLTLPAGSRPAVAANFAQLESLAEFVDALPLPPETEAAPTFVP